MRIPLQVSFKGMASSPALEARIRERAEGLERFHPNLISCRVVVEEPHRHHQQGRIFAVHVDVTVPGDEIVVSREPDNRHTHEDAYVAVADAFDEVARRLDERARIDRNEVKQHAHTPTGKVVHISPPEDFGFVKTIEGNDVYFHRNSVIEGDFDRIELGDELRFVLHESDGAQGPHASSVRVIRRHRHSTPG
ncbi:MAG: HPF/RaiA family ribosome-associated protein [Deltaproteobacteria bacterium]|nr:HPF/RaiA family ribosome-associated protein [Deltaproteobacteria bacterium]